MSRVAYVRKTDTVRREPGGLERAVLMLVNDGFSTSLRIAAVLETSIDNVNGAIGRLQTKRCVSASYDTVPRFWTITATGRKTVGDEELWL
jgi:hypothetical protein